MLINQTFEIDSCDDVELNIKRTSKLEYRISYDDEKDIKATVFIVGGFGANANISFLDSYRNYIAKNFDVATINVFYHCFCQRRSDVEKYSAYKYFQEEDIENIKNLLNQFHFSYGEINNDNALFLANSLVKHVENLKMQNKLDHNFKLNFTSTFIPPNGDYQNFGIMAAIDHINALKDLVKCFPKFADLPKIYGGGSYGGYLSLLIAKIAPWYVDGVIDNSGSALPPLNYILGREMEHSYGDYYEDFPHNRIIFFLKTHWTRKENSPYFFNNENYFIRTLLNKDHLILQSQKNKNIIYVSYHSDKDPLTPANFKQQTMQILKILGYDVSLNLIDENKIDGKFIKNLDHGCGIPDKALFRKELPLMLEKLQKRKSFMQENSISYPCGNKVFIFKDVGDKFELVIKD
ncbi:carbonic anhydrase [Campylobacter jejuni]|nr:carbonic anhydrase [Campylobacter jejuni]